MKGNKLKLFGIIAAVAVIGFSMASCGDGANGGGWGGTTSFTVTYHRGNSGAGVAPPRETARAGDTIQLPGAGRLTSPGTGYVLTWSTVNEGSAMVSVTVSGLPITAVPDTRFLGFPRLVSGTFFLL